jgi:hypothetical protein
MRFMTAMLVTFGAFGLACVGDDGVDRFREPIPDAVQLSLRAGRCVGPVTALGAMHNLSVNEPTRVDAKRAVWGPTEDGGRTWRLIVEEIGEGEYEYLMQSQSPAGLFTTLLRGHGYASARAEHGTGSFEYRGIDPVDATSTKVTYDFSKTPSSVEAICD